LASKKHEFEHDVKLDLEARVRQGVKAVLEEVLQEEMSQHLEAGYRELTPTRAPVIEIDLPLGSRCARRSPPHPKH
jgi:transposase-like protein